MDQYTDEELRRGIDLQNRAWSKTNKSLQKLFQLWKGGGINRITVLLILFLIGLNEYMAEPLLFKNNVPTFTGSVSLRFAASMFAKIGISQHIFFTILVQVGLLLSVVALYLFIRKIVHRHELTAFFATFFFIIPNPFFGNEPVLIHAVLQGDGAHVIAFSLMLLVVLYIRSFVSIGNGDLAILAVVGATIVALISPFALFNLLILGFIATVAEGFVGEMRLKLARYIFLCIYIFGLSLFWYYPHFVQQILFQRNINSALNKFWSIFPLMIPLIPLLGTITFLVFDRRPVLKPIFMSLGIFTTYFLLFIMSKSINASGIFIASRYFVEMAFALSFFGALIAVLGIEFLYIRLQSYLVKQHALFGMGIVFIISFVAFFTLFLLFSSVQQAHAEVAASTIMVSMGGAVKMTRLFTMRDIGSDISLIISLITCVLLVSTVRMRKTKL